MKYQCLLSEKKKKKKKKEKNACIINSLSAEFAHRVVKVMTHISSVIFPIKYKPFQYILFISQTYFFTGYAILQ